jgi:hypothetical protein
MDLYLKLIFFFIISILYFWSVIGYGKIIGFRNSNYFETYLDGTILLLILSYIIYFTTGTNLIINTITLCVGLLLYFLDKKKFKTISFKSFFLLFFSIFSILIISKTHEDFNGYHYFSIHEVFNHSLRIGVYKLNSYFIHSSLLVLNQSLLVLPYFDFKLIHLPVFLIYFSTLGYFINILFEKKIKFGEIFYSLVCVLILLIKFNRLSEFGYDYITQFILLIVFHKIYFLSLDNSELVKSILYFVLTVLIKPISLLFLPIMFFIIYKKGFIFYRSVSRSRYLLIFSLLIILFSSSFLKTGCVFYPVNKTCFSVENVSWSTKNHLKIYSETVSLWAKSYWVQDGSKYEKINDIKLFNKNFNWVKFWIEKHFFYKVFEFVLIVIGSIILIYIYFTKQKLKYKNKSKEKKEKLVIFLLSLFSILFWFNTVPQFRFGFAAIIIFIYLIFSYIFNLNILFNKKKFFHILILGLLILNIKNFKRIKTEFERNDFYKFKNFPFYNEKIIKNDYSNLNKRKIFHIDILE